MFIDPGASLVRMASEADLVPLLPQHSIVWTTMGGMAISTIDHPLRDLMVFGKGKLGPYLSMTGITESWWLLPQHISLGRCTVGGQVTIITGYITEPMITLAEVEAFGLLLMTFQTDLGTTLGRFSRKFEHGILIWIFHMGTSWSVTCLASLQRRRGLLLLFGQIMGRLLIILIDLIMTGHTLLTADIVCLGHD